MGGWADNVEYKFKIEYTAINVKIFVDGNLIFDVDGSFNSGKFGFYNYSQSFVRYKGFVQPFSAVVNKVNASCLGANDGSASAAPTANGVGPFEYAWSTVDKTQSISVLASGNYAVTIKQLILVKILKHLRLEWKTR